VQLRLLSGTDFSTMANATTLTLGANLENLNALDTGSTKLNLTGNNLGNTLTGNDANNILDGGAGVDTLIGGLGDDTYMLDLKVSAGNIVFDDSITELDGNNEGIDTIKLRGTATLARAATLTLDNDWANIEILDASATGSTKLNLTGNNLGNTLIGNAAANILTGGTGDDTLNGGAGIDTMIGGEGNDTYIVDNIADIVTEDSNEGTDLVKASVSYTLGANIENLELTGAAAINGTGNGLDNVIKGNAGNNVLDGGAGADRMEGGKGNDTYIVDDEDDEVIEAANGGTDLVKASVDYELTDFVENLTLTGNDHINGTGNALANTITGNAGNNILDGGDGVDKLIGGPVMIPTSLTSFVQALPLLTSRSLCKIPSLKPLMQAVIPCNCAYSVALTTAPWRMQLPSASVRTLKDSMPLAQNLSNSTSLAMHSQILSQAMMQITSLMAALE